MQDSQKKTMKSFREVPGLNSYNEQEIKSKKRLMWFAIICIVAVIGVMWIWNMIILVYNTSQNDAFTPDFLDVRQQVNQTLESDTLGQ